MPCPSPFSPFEIARICCHVNQQTILFEVVVQFIVRHRVYNLRCVERILAHISSLKTAADRHKRDSAICGTVNYASSHVSSSSQQQSSLSQNTWMSNVDVCGFHLILCVNAEKLTFKFCLFCSVLRCSALERYAFFANSRRHNTRTYYRRARSTQNIFFLLKNAKFNINNK